MHSFESVFQKLVFAFVPAMVKISRAIKRLPELCFVLTWVLRCRNTPSLQICLKQTTQKALDT